MLQKLFSPEKHGLESFGGGSDPSEVRLAQAVVSAVPVVLARVALISSLSSDTPFFFFKTGCAVSELRCEGFSLWWPLLLRASG